MEVIGSTMISKERLEEIKNFENKDFSDCPVLTEEQLKDMKPSHLLKNNCVSDVQGGEAVRKQTKFASNGANA